MFAVEGGEPFADLVPDTAEPGHDLLFISDNPGRVVEADMEPMVYLAREDGTALACLVANRDRVIKRFMEESVDTLRVCAGHRNPDLLHGGDSFRMHRDGRSGPGRCHRERRVE